MRLPYVPEDPQLPNAEDQAVVERVKERRGGKLIALDRALLHAPPVANGWNALLKSIRTETSIPASIRELAMCRVAVLNRAWYEWESHLPLLVATSAVSEAGVQALKDTPAHGDPPQGALDEKHAAVMRYTDAMTVGCVVPQAVFDGVRGFFGEREVVEITATVATYNCVSRFLVALDVGEMGDKYGVDMS